MIMLAGIVEVVIMMVVIVVVMGALLLSLVLVMKGILCVLVMGCDIKVTESILVRWL